MFIMEILKEDDKHLEDIFNSVFNRHTIRSGVAIVASLVAGGAYAYFYGNSPRLGHNDLMIVMDTAITIGVMATAYALSHRKMWREYDSRADNYLLNESPNREEYKKQKSLEARTKPSKPVPNVITS